MKVLITTAYAETTRQIRFLELAALDRFRIHGTTNDPDEADIILFAEAPQPPGDWFFSAVYKHPLVRAFREKCFMYNERDEPWCVLPGLYTSLSTCGMNRARQRPFGYVCTPNPYIHRFFRSTGKPDLLFSFMGSFQTHRVRRMLANLSHPEGYVEDTRQYWMLGDGNDYLRSEGEQAIRRQKQKYAAILHRSQFVLCPRGNGPTSFRLFETMSAGRVPVVLSDDWAPPEGPHWEQFIIRIPEAGTPDLIEILLENRKHSLEMGEIALEEYSKWFASDVLFHHAVEACGELLRLRRYSESLMHRIPNLDYWQKRARSALRTIVEPLRTFVRHGQ